MIIEARYTPQEGEAKRYLLLVLNPRFLNQVHALSLDDFGFIVFDKLAQEQGLRFIPRFQEFKGLDIAKLDLPRSPQAFYSKNLKAALKSYFNRAYRTMDLNSFGSINIVDYKFNKSTELELERKEVDAGTEDES